MSFILSQPLVALILGLVSLVIIILFFERLHFYATCAQWSEDDLTKLITSVQSGRLHDARHHCEERPNLLTGILNVVLKSTHLSKSANRESVEIEERGAIEDVQKGIGLFFSLSLAAFFVGLVGTLLGIADVLSTVPSSSKTQLKTVSMAVEIGRTMTPLIWGATAAATGFLFRTILAILAQNVISRLKTHPLRLISAVYASDGE